ncbi:MAG: YhcH/YjgK/YiaL family protein [Bacteroidales bacterium]|nr:YhcH/YjgK/YiaL family protein [Bacteroidales bacterium]MDE7127239.1 YhcH/YjgK/YiaL family protein [Bacteroidales bacterium]
MEEKLMHNPYYAKAVEYIRSTDLDALEPGKHLIDGENLFVNIVDSQMKTPQQARLEVHDRYIDIQIPLSKAETYGVKPRVACTEPDGEFNMEKDILFYRDPVEETVTAQPGEAVTFAPETAHAPLIGEGTIRKAIFKVLVVE